MMLAARNVALRVNGVCVRQVRVRRSKNGPELIIADPLSGDFAVADDFTFELLELVHPPEIRLRLPNQGWRKVPLRILIALLQGAAIRII